MLQLSVLKDQTALAIAGLQKRNYKNAEAEIAAILDIDLVLIAKFDVNLNDALKISLKRLGKADVFEMLVSNEKMLLSK